MDGLVSEPSPESSLGGLWVCAEGLDTLKIEKNSIDLQCFLFQFGGLGALFGGISPQNPPLWRRDLFVCDLLQNTRTYSIYVQCLKQLTRYKIIFQTQENKKCNLYQNEIKTTSLLLIQEKTSFFSWAATSAQDGTTTDV